jgi:hypothetical protein
MRPATLQGIDRRAFVRAVGAAGMAGVVGGSLAAPAAQAAQAGQGGAGRPPAGGAPEFPKPASLKQGAQLDSRFPVSFAAPVAESFKLVTEYFTALSQRDLTALGRTLHFPFAIYEASSRSWCRAPRSWRQLRHRR